MGEEARHPGRLRLVRQRWSRMKTLTIRHAGLTSKSNVLCNITIGSWI
jgi:hypothetical protein